MRDVEVSECLTLASGTLYREVTHNPGVEKHWLARIMKNHGTDPQNIHVFDCVDVIYARCIETSRE